MQLLFITQLFQSEWCTPQEADLSGANLAGADLSDAKLNEANLSGAYLVIVDLTDAKVTKARRERRNMEQKIQGGKRGAFLPFSQLAACPPPRL